MGMALWPLMRWKEMIVVSCYLSPNRDRTEIRATLDALESALKRAEGESHLVFGDFNAWSVWWLVPHHRLWSADGGVDEKVRLLPSERGAGSDVRPAPRVVHCGSIMGVSSANHADRVASP